MRMSQPALKRLFALTCFCLLVLTTLTAQTTIKGLRKGKLPNGLTYYIYNDGSDTKEAQYYLYQNVGAMLCRAQCAHNRRKTQSTDAVRAARLVSRHQNSAQRC